MNEQDNVIKLRERQEFVPRSCPVDDPILVAVLKLKDQPIRRVNWPAVRTFATISIAALASAVIVPQPPDQGISWSTAMALVVSVFAGGVAMLYRHSRSFWVLR